MSEPALTALFAWRRNGVRRAGSGRVEHAPRLQLEDTGTAGFQPAGAPAAEATFDRLKEPAGSRGTGRQDAVAPFLSCAPRIGAVQRSSSPVDDELTGAAPGARYHRGWTIADELRIGSAAHARRRLLRKIQGCACERLTQSET